METQLWKQKLEMETVSSDKMWIKPAQDSPSIIIILRNRTHFTTRGGVFAE